MPYLRSRSFLQHSRAAFAVAILVSSIFASVPAHAAVQVVDQQQRVARAVEDAFTSAAEPLHRFSRRGIVESVEIRHELSGDVVIAVDVHPSIFSRFTDPLEFDEALQRGIAAVGNLEEYADAEARGGAPLGFELTIGGEPLRKAVDPADHEPQRYQANSVATDAATKRIAISPGHGWYWNAAARQWRLQRGHWWGIVEDFVNSDIVAYLRNELHRSGMSTLPTRDLSKTSGIGTTGHPRWEESAMVFLPSLGVPRSVTHTRADNYSSDINSRPLYANWSAADILVSIHNNGGGGSGTETWYCASNSSAASSRKLATIVHNKLISKIRSQYNAQWRDRGVKFGDGYGENNQATRPSILIELAFMDRQSPDNAALKDERFKQLAASAISEGIAEFLGVNSTPALNLDVQAQSDMDRATSREWRFFGRINGTFGKDLNWASGWQLRWNDYFFSGNRVVRMFHATSTTNGLVRYTMFWDPDRGAWTNWTPVQ